MIRPDHKAVYTALLALGSFPLALSEGALRLLDVEFRLLPTRVDFGWPNPQSPKTD